MKLRILRSFVKIKPSQIGDITLSFTDIGKACPVRDFLRRKCVVYRYTRKSNYREKFRIDSIYSWTLDKNLKLK